MHGSNDTKIISPQHRRTCKGFIAGGEVEMEIASIVNGESFVHYRCVLHKEGEVPAPSLGPKRVGCDDEEEEADIWKEVSDY